MVILTYQMIIGKKNLKNTTTKPLNQMDWYKIVFKKNGNWSFSVFKYADEAEKKTKLERWKADHVNPYNKIEVIWHGEYTDQDLNYPPVRRIKKKSIWVIYAKLMQFLGRLFKIKNLSTDATI